MTEYEAAMIALRETGNMIALGVGLTQAVLIAGGLLVMRKAANQRDKMHDEAMAAFKEQRQDATEQHRETMTALQEQHRETMRGLEALMAALKEQRQDATEQHREAMRALEALIERTARPAS